MSKTEKVVSFFILTGIFLLSGAMLFGVARADEYQCVNFVLEQGDQVQKRIGFNSDDPYWHNNMSVYQYIPGNPFFDNPGEWLEIQPNERLTSGLYRFVSEGNSEATICGNMTSWSNYRELMDSEDVHLMLPNEWNPANIGLLPRNDENGNYKYSYLYVSPGFGVSTKISMIDTFADHSGLPVAAIIFSDAGFPKRVVWLHSRAAKNNWLNPTESAILIIYTGDDWRADKKIFRQTLRDANAFLKAHRKANR
jgi:hypothetical protein